MMSGQADSRASLRARAFEPIDSAWLVALRVLLGLLICISLQRIIWYGRIEPNFVAPGFHFTYWGLSFIKPLPGPYLYALAWALSGLALLMAAGVCFRACAALVLLGFSYLQLVDVTVYLNHYYLVSLLCLLLLVSPAGKRAAQVPAFWLWLFRAQVAIVYTFAGLAKCTSDWLIHAQPMRIWLAARVDLPVLGPWLAQPWAAPVFSWLGCLFDCTIVFWLLWPRTRAFAYAAVVAFHALTYVLFPNIGMFPAIMLVAALAFFPPSWPRVFIQRRAASPAEVGTVPRWALPLAAAYLAIQTAVPLRYLAYGDDVLWHEQGMRFSWRVMVRKKAGSVTFTVREQTTGRSYSVQPEQYLTAFQVSEMSEQPDLILQLAHHIGADFEARGVGPVSVHADALVSLNGRPAQQLIDPRVDLTQVRASFARAAWILPAPTEAPPEIRAAL